jgi:NTP pyrophosphatase (non-canonical NTP hydrolase)
MLKPIDVEVLLKRYLSVELEITTEFGPKEVLSVSLLYDNEIISSDTIELPDYEFDLFWDIKTVDQLRTKIQQEGSTVDDIKQAMREHNIVIEGIDTTPRGMTFDEYQKLAYTTATYPYVGNNIIYPAMGAAGEAGELLDKVKKHWRNYGVSIQELKEQLTKEQVDEIIKEAGDVLWYLGAICTELGISMQDMVDINIAKFQDRRKRGVVKGEGDNR